MSGRFGRTGAVMRQRTIDLLTRATARAAGTGPVVVPEYDLHPEARYGWDDRPPMAALASLIDGWLERHLDTTAERLASLTQWCRSIPRTSTDGPCWENDFWGGLDAVWQVAMLRDRNPRQYIEVGSGYSTLFAHRAVTDFGLRTRITSIDPSPRRLVDHVCDRVLRCTLERADLSVFETLVPGDIVFVDGSHVVSMNSDAVVFFLDVLPLLPSGVIVAIDDIYLPWDYHPSWTTRGYGEQYLLGAYLLGSRTAEQIRYPGWAVARSLADTADVADLWSTIEYHFGRVGSSFWLEPGAAHVEPPG